ncbi:putative LRR receptor-like serine/threonine-protein kinase [Prunus yedoensis var. nudiflora]|uniref:Putative LRR receptor-like serine/threonine-protein kinase n=1 Tax=Prunus yedoensis var. nudiflora TaxID=2094558 RepID=A0A314YWC4_PRUYE|nr:putative LRR receptor-like serine/threonine-protein kinase [Prunus yedoensis var. nudiflora]
MNMKKLPFLLLAILTLRCLKPISAACHVDDEAGLLAFKSGITADPSNKLSSWKPGTDCCAWAGINCLNNNRVTSLLSGVNRPTQHLLIGRHISPKPQPLGSIPGSPIRAAQPPIRLHRTHRLSGRIPDKIGNLTQLFSLSFYYNLFTGPIPSSISKLTRLSQLNLGGNLLTGSIPYGIKNLKSLTCSISSETVCRVHTRFLQLIFGPPNSQAFRNKFSGKIPASISALAPKLAYLELGHNALTGQIPDFLGNFKALDTLDLSYNGFSGIVPQRFVNLTKIFNLDLSHNYLTDPFPQLYVKGIESLDLSYNGFHLNQIPKWVTSSPIIYSLKLAKCGIKLKLEDWKPAETYFYDFIDLSENEITGSPIGLLNKTGFLVGFSASGNKLKFNLESLRIVKTLKQLDLSRNLVFGKVPSGVSGLDRLNVSHNHLCGPIPATKFAASAFLGNDCLCGAPLAACK